MDLYVPNLEILICYLVCINSISVLNYFSAIVDCQPLVFYKAQQSNPGFELFSLVFCNKVREVAGRRTVMYDDGGMNDETSATV